MNLGNCRICPQVTVADMSPAVAFYEGTLGLAPQAVQREESRAYGCGEGTSLYVYEAPAHAGKATSTVARWDVDDLDRAVAELAARGLRFERYGDPVATDDRGIHDSGYGKVAWFTDPDGNTFALEQR